MRSPPDVVEEIRIAPSLICRIHQGMREVAHTLKSEYLGNTRTARKQTLPGALRRAFQEPLNQS